MPVILEQDAFGDWLDPKVESEGLLDLLTPLEAGKLEAYRVNKRVGRVSKNDAELLASAQQEWRMRARGRWEW